MENDLPFGYDEDAAYDAFQKQKDDWAELQNRRMEMYAFPGRQWALIGDNEQEVPTQGLTKREYAAIKMMASLSTEYVKKPSSAIIEMMASTAVKMTDALYNELERPTSKENKT